MGWNFGIGLAGGIPLIAFFMQADLNPSVLASTPQFGRGKFGFCRRDAGESAREDFVGSVGLALREENVILAAPTAFAVLEGNGFRIAVLGLGDELRWIFENLQLRGFQLFVGRQTSISTEEDALA